MKLTGTFRSEDTLYVGTTKINYKYYYPVAAGMEIIDEFSIDLGAGGYSASAKCVGLNMNWAIGLANYIAPQKELVIAANICDYPDTTTVVTINNP